MDRSILSPICGAICSALSHPTRKAKRMIAISTEVGLWILDAYRRMRSQLQLSGAIGTEVPDSAVVISASSPINSKICFEFPDPATGQNPKWVVTLSGAEFWFDATGKVPGSDAPDTGDWRSFLQIKLANGLIFLLG